MSPSSETLVYPGICSPLPKAPLAAEFCPLPFLRNRHVQTLLAHFLPAPSFNQPSMARILSLPDGDALVLHDSVPPVTMTSA